MVVIVAGGLYLRGEKKTPQIST